MPELLHIPFPHRQNSDDSFDAICPLCHRTIARVKTEADLRQLEVVHNCDELEASGYHVYKLYD